MEDVLLFPFGGNAREALLAISAQNRIEPTFNVIGFVDDDERLWGKYSCGVKVLGGRGILPNYPSARVLAVPGNPQNFIKRSEIIALLDLPPERYITVIDPSVRIASDAKVGQNALLLANVVVSCSVEIGNHCVVLANTVIAHDSYIGDYTVVGSNVTISGSCIIGSGCYIGSGSRVKDHLTVGPQCLIGLGSCVIRDIPAKSVVAGNPARSLV